MGPFRFLSVTIFSMLVGVSTLAYAQDDKKQDDKPTRQEEPKAEPRQDEAKPRQDDRAAKPDRKDEQSGKRQEEQPQQRPEQRETRDQARPEQQERPDQHADRREPAGKGARIPDDKFHAHFGRSHSFAARGVIVQGRPQFQYEGYTFELVDAWPQDWAYTDDCYIDDVDGEYFLFDLLHPGMRVAVYVIM